MEELAELRACIEQERYADALILLGEMEEMSRDDKINKIESFLQVLLLHLIKQAVEGRSTRSWEVSIQNAAAGIARSNKRRQAGGYYLGLEDLRDGIEEVFPSALRQASLEALEGRFDECELATLFNPDRVKQQVLQLLLQRQAVSA